jgi:hypothetical protein
VRRRELARGDNDKIVLKPQRVAEKEQGLLCLPKYRNLAESKMLDEMLKTCQNQNT